MTWTAGLSNARTRSICHRDKRGLKDQARCLFGGSGTGCRRRRGFTGQCQVDVVDAENRRLSRRMPLRRNGSRESIAVLKVCPGVGEHCIATGQLAVLQHDNAGSFSQRGPVPGRITAVSKHVPTCCLASMQSTSGSIHRLPDGLPAGCFFLLKCNEPWYAGGDDRYSMARRGSYLNHRPVRHDGRYPRSIGSNSVSERMMRSGLTVDSAGRPSP